MATETPWTDAGFDDELRSKLGSDWEQQLQDTWGSDWENSCAQALAADLGSDWSGDAGAAAEKLAEWIGGAAADESAAPTTEESADSGQPVSVDLSQYPWLSTVAESDSVKSWLVRVGVPDEQATALADESGALAGSGATDGERPSVPELSQYQWLSTVAESDSLKSWLVRVGMSDEQATALADGGDGAAAGAPGAPASTGAAAPAPLADLSQYQWLNLVGESDSVKSWLVRVGLPEAAATAFDEAAGKE